MDRIKDVWGQLTVGPLRQLLVRTAAQVDPDAVTAHAEDERARRGLTRRMGVHGTDHWRGDFRVEQARGAWAAVTERARQLVREGKADSLELARADAMMELIAEHCDIKVVIHATRAADDTATASAPPAAETSAPAGATGAAEDLVEVGGLGGPGTTFVRRDWLANAGTSTPERELSCDTTTGALVHGDVPAAFARGQARARAAHRARERAKDQAMKDAKRRGRSRDSDSRSIQEIVEEAIDFSESYRVPDPMARLIRLRDGSCRFPGCAVPALQCDLDHVRPWPAGPTSPTNLMCLCRRHHRIKQRDGWAVKLHPDGTVTWADPTGLQRTTRPVDHLHLITAGHTHRDATTRTRIAADPADIASTFEEELIELLGGPNQAQPRDHTTGFDIDGNTFGGPPPRIDLDRTLETGVAPWNRS